MPVPPYACSANPTAEGSEIARPQAGILQESAGRSKNTRSAHATRDSRIPIKHRVKAEKGKTYRTPRPHPDQGHNPDLATRKRLLPKTQGLSLAWVEHRPWFLVGGAQES